MQLTGMTKEKGAQASMPLTFGGAYVLNLIGAAGLAFLLGGDGSWQGGLHTGLFTGLFFIATALGVIYLFEQRPLKLWFINAGYQVVNFAAMGTIVGAWPVSGTAASGRRPARARRLPVFLRHLRAQHHRGMP